MLFVGFADAKSIGGCNSYGQEVYMPIAYTCQGAALAFILLALWGFYAYRNQSEESIERFCDRLIGIENRPERMDVGWDSQEQAMGWPEQESLRPYTKIGRWDQGMCCGLQCGCVGLILCILFSVLSFCAALGDSYFYLQWVYDWKWGFALQEGYPYTSPVWLGEFGGDVRGRYWMHLLRYVSVRDLDFAYWNLNGRKLVDGMYNVHTGEFVNYDHPRWEDETYGLLNADEKTIRQPWKLLDIQQVMMSPAGWTPDSYPCDREVLGRGCGG